MAETLGVEVDIKEVQTALAGTSKSIISIQKQALGIIAKGAVSQLKAYIKLSVHSRTGELAKAYRYKVKKDASQANVYPKAMHSDSTIFPKAMTLSYGHTGPTKTAKNWNVKALGFVQKAKAWVDSGAYDNELQKMVDKTLDKYWG